MRRFLARGVAAHGFVRVHCGDCGHDRLAPRIDGRSRPHGAARFISAPGARGSAPSLLPRADRLIKAWASHD
jgi:hypothetical protein